METYSTLSDLRPFAITPKTIQPGAVIAIIGNNDELAQRVLLDLCWALRRQVRYAKVFSRRLQTTEFYKSIVPTPFICHGQTMKEKEMRSEFQKWFKHHRSSFIESGDRVSTMLFLDEVVTDGGKNNKETSIYDEFFDVKDIGITTIIRAIDGVAGIPNALKKLVNFTFILNNSADIHKLQKQYAYMMFEKPHVFPSLIAACHPLQCLVVERDPQHIDNDLIVDWHNYIKRFECGDRREVNDVRLCPSRLWHYAAKNTQSTPIDNDLHMYTRLLHNCAQATGKKLVLRVAK